MTGRHSQPTLACKPGIRRRLGDVSSCWTREDPSSEYKRFVAANEEATRLCVPVLDKIRTPLRSRHPEVAAARGRVEEARLGFVSVPTAERREILNKAKQLLSTTRSRGRN